MERGVLAVSCVQTRCLVVHRLSIQKPLPRRPISSDRAVHQLPECSEVQLTLLPVGPEGLAHHPVDVGRVLHCVELDVDVCFGIGQGLEERVGDAEGDSEVNQALNLNSVHVQIKDAGGGEPRESKVQPTGQLKRLASLEPW
jgi:hypothetical protein